MLYSNLKEFVNRFRHLLFVLMSLVAVVCIYMILSFIYVGRVDAVPLKWQKHLEISQKELYKNLDNFSIVGVDRNVIRSNADNATIRVDVGDRVSEDYVRLSLVVARLNTTNHYPKGWLLQYSDRTGKQAERSFNFLQDGFNSSKLIKGGISTQFNIFSHNVMRGFSMELERAYLSKYPVLPNSFIAPFITLVLFVVLVVWCCIYKGLHNWFLARNWALLVLIIAAQLLVMVYYKKQAKDFIGEEDQSLYSANWANSERTGTLSITPSDSWTLGSMKQDYDEPTTPTWLSPYDMERIMTAQPDEGLSHFNKLRQRDRHHSPTYHMQLHLVSMLFMDRFSLWFGTMLNIPYYIATCLVLYVISKRFLSGRTALLPLIFYGFSSAAVHTVISGRSFTMATFFFTLLLYMALDMLDKSKLSGKFYILLAIVFFLGFDAYYYFAPWLTGIAVIPLISLARQKRFKDITKCAIALIFSFIAHQYVFYGVAGTNWRASRDIGETARVLIKMIADINSGLFGGTLYWWILTIAALASISIYHNGFCRSNNKKDVALKCITITLGLSVVLLVDAKYMPEIFLALRHYYPCMPAVVLLLVLVSKELVSFAISRIKIRQAILTTIVLILTLICWKSSNIYMDGESELIHTFDYAAFAEPYRNVPVIAVYCVNRPILFRHLREAIAIPPGDEQALIKALNDIRDDKQVIFYIPAYEWLLSSGIATISDIQTMSDVIQRHGYTKRVPFIGGDSWIFYKE
ncbi:hypothetical protein RsTz2092_09200 [Deferribacterales bacterium RsTz2092]|nr:hypothetical protein AGMMS49941_07070 [Deferribacterales bacterium]